MSNDLPSVPDEFTQALKGFNAEESKKQFAAGIPSQESTSPTQETVSPGGGDQAAIARASIEASQQLQTVPVELKGRAAEIIAKAVENQDARRAETSGDWQSEFGANREERIEKLREAIVSAAIWNKNGNGGDEDTLKQESYGENSGHVINIPDFDTGGETYYNNDTAKTPLVNFVPLDSYARKKIKNEGTKAAESIGYKSDKKGKDIKSSVWAEGSIAISYAFMADNLDKSNRGGHLKGVIVMSQSNAEKFQRELESDPTVLFDAIEAVNGPVRKFDGPVTDIRTDGDITILANDKFGGERKEAIHTKPFPEGYKPFGQKVQPLSPQQEPPLMDLTKFFPEDDENDTLDEVKESMKSHLLEIQKTKQQISDLDEAYDKATATVDQEDWKTAGEITVKKQALEDEMEWLVTSLEGDRSKFDDTEAQQIIEDGQKRGEAIVQKAKEMAIEAGNSQPMAWLEYMGDAIWQVDKPVKLNEGNKKREPAQLRQTDLGTFPVVEQDFEQEKDVQDMLIEAMKEYRSAERRISELHFIQDQAGAQKWLGMPERNELTRLNEIVERVDKLFADRYGFNNHRGLYGQTYDSFGNDDVKYKLSQKQNELIDLAKRYFSEKGDKNQEIEEWFIETAAIYRQVGVAPKIGFYDFKDRFKNGGGTIDTQDLEAMLSELGGEIRNEDDVPLWLREAGWGTEAPVDDLEKSSYDGLIFNNVRDLRLAVGEDVLTPEQAELFVREKVHLMDDTGIWSVLETSGLKSEEDKKKIRWIQSEIHKYRKDTRLLLTMDKDSLKKELDGVPEAELDLLVDLDLSNNSRTKKLFEEGKISEQTRKRVHELVDKRIQADRSDFEDDLFFNDFLEVLKAERAANNVGAGESRPGEPYNEEEARAAANNPLPEAAGAALLGTLATMGGIVDDQSATPEARKAARKGLKEIKNWLKKNINKPTLKGLSQANKNLGQLARDVVSAPFKGGGGREWGAVAARVATDFVPEAGYAMLLGNLAAIGYKERRTWVKISKENKGKTWKQRRDIYMAQTTIGKFMGEGESKLTQEQRDKAALLGVATAAAGFLASEAVSYGVRIPGLRSAGRMYVNRALMQIAAPKIIDTLAGQTIKEENKRKEFVEMSLRFSSLTTTAATSLMTGVALGVQGTGYTDVIDKVGEVSNKVADKMGDIDQLVAAELVSDSNSIPEIISSVIEKEVSPVVEEMLAPESQADATPVPGAEQSSKPFGEVLNEIITPANEQSVSPVTPEPQVEEPGAEAEPPAVEQPAQEEPATQLESLQPEENPEIIEGRRLINDMKMSPGVIRQTDSLREWDVDRNGIGDARVELNAEGEITKVVTSDGKILTLSDEGEGGILKEVIKLNPNWSPDKASIVAHELALEGIKASEVEKIEAGLVGREPETPLVVPKDLEEEDIPGGSMKVDKTNGVVWEMYSDNYGKLQFDPNAAEGGEAWWQFVLANEHKGDPDWDVDRIVKEASDKALEFQKGYDAQLASENIATANPESSLTAVTDTEAEAETESSGSVNYEQTDIANPANSDFHPPNGFTIAKVFDLDGDNKNDSAWFKDQNGEITTAQLPDGTSMLIGNENSTESLLYEYVANQSNFAEPETVKEVSLAIAESKNIDSPENAMEFVKSSEAVTTFYTELVRYEVQDWLTDFFHLTNDQAQKVMSAVKFNVTTTDLKAYNDINKYMEENVTITFMNKEYRWGEIPVPELKKLFENLDLVEIK